MGGAGGDGAAVVGVEERRSAGLGGDQRDQGTDSAKSEETGEEI